MVQQQPDHAQRDQAIEDEQRRFQQRKRDRTTALFGLFHAFLPFFRKPGAIPAALRSSAIRLP